MGKSLVLAADPYRLCFVAGSDPRSHPSTTPSGPHRRLAVRTPRPRSSIDVDSSCCLDRLFALVGAGAESVGGVAFAGPQVTGSLEQEIENLSPRGHSCEHRTVSCVPQLPIPLHSQVTGRRVVSAKLPEAWSPAATILANLWELAPAATLFAALRRSGHTRRHPTAAGRNSCRRGAHASSRA
jgi:hypothetical protein